MTIAITGATGQLGRLIIDKLQEKAPGAHLVGLARSPSKAKGLGIAVREADYSRPETLVSALQGIDILMLVSSSEVGARSLQHKNVIDAAKTARVGRIVYTSVLRAEISPLSVAEEHFDTEIRLKVCGVPFTILRNGWYTENYVAAVPAAVQHGALFGSAAEGRISSAARADYAEAAAMVLTSSSHAGRTYELAGDSAYTLAGLAREISRQTGKEIPYKNLPRRQYAAFLEAMGLPAEAAEEYAGFDVAASHGALFDNAGQLSALIDRPTTPLSFVVAEALERAAIAVAPGYQHEAEGLKRAL